MLVTVRGIVRSADKNPNSRMPTAVFLRCLPTAVMFRAMRIPLYSGTNSKLLDAEVEVTGVAGGQFDGKMQMHGVQLNVSSASNVKILKRAGASPWSLPLTPMDQMISGYHVTDRTQRVRVHGTITYYQPGSSVVLQDGSRSLWISTLTIDPLQ
jgi:hypothetical protein